MRITSLIENTAGQSHLACEAGMSLYIEHDGKNILVDTGASSSFIANAKALGKDLSALDYVILSHNHSDHGGGLRALREQYGNKYQLIISPYFFERKYRRFGEVIRYIGNNFSPEYLSESGITTVYPMSDTYLVTDGVYLLSAISSANAFEDEPNDFLAYRAGEYVPDMFREEVFLAFDMPGGLVVIAGCGHRGVANICDGAKARLGKPPRAIVGGLHLKDSAPERVRRTIAYLKKESVALLATGHCNGDVAEGMLASSAMEILPLSSGTILEFE